MVWLAVGAGLLLRAALADAACSPRRRVETIRKGAVWGGAAVGGGVLLLVLTTGRGAQALWTLGLFAPLALALGPRLVRRPPLPLAGGGAGRHRCGRRERGRDRDPGDAAGPCDRADERHRAAAAARRGASSPALTLPELLALLADCRAEDPDSVALLEAWLDRLGPDWRAAEAAAPPPGAAGRRAG